MGLRILLRLPQGQFAKKAARVELEHSVGCYKPDISLFDRSGKPIAVIEVIVTHRLSAAALDFYHQHKIAVVLYLLKSKEDIKRLVSPVLEPDRVHISVCPHPRCPTCGNYMKKKRLLIIDARCWRCNAPMKVAAVQGEYLGCGEFEPSDIQLARRHGGCLASRYSQTANRRYIANVCRQCGAFIGTHYLPLSYIVEAKFKRFALDAGFFCLGCF